MSPLAVTQILYSGVGGHGAVAFAMARGDRERALGQSFLFYGVEPLATGYRAACEGLGAPYRTVIKRRGVDVAAARAVLRSLDELAPRVVFLHSIALAAVVKRWCQRNGAALVAVDHHRNQLKRRRDLALALLAHTITDRSVVLTETFAREVRDYLGPLASLARLTVIGNGIDLDAFASPRRGVWGAKKPLLVGMHSRFVPGKDHATLIRGVALARADGLEVTLHLAGDGETRPALERLVRELGVSERVAFRGALPESAIPAFLKGLDVFVHSTLGENMSTAVMQAMAAGLPIVASDAPGVTPMLEEGRTALLFPVGDAAGFVAALGRLAADPPLAERLASAALERARDQFGDTRMARAYAALARELAYGSPASPDAAKAAKAGGGLRPGHAGRPPEALDEA